jgi:hypothetical protein
LLVGPRQCGKSTLARHALPNWTHLDLERPADLAVLAADLEEILRRASPLGGDRRKAGRRTARMTRAIEGILVEMTSHAHLLATPERAETVSKRIL